MTLTWMDVQIDRNVDGHILIMVQSSRQRERGAIPLFLHHHIHYTHNYSHPQSQTRSESEISCQWRDVVRHV